jgi:hypothetical protein
MGEEMKKRAFAIIAVSILLAGIGGCYYVPTGFHGTARASIAAKDVPVNIASIALIVTAPGMLPIQKTYSASVESIDLEVPAGLGRTFTLLLTTASATLKAEATVDLKAGETQNILLTPKLAGTDIVIPDARNNRIVQISDMTGKGWIEKGSTDFGGGPFAPYDVDFDDQGRIYIANAAARSSTGEIIRIDDITNVSPYLKVDPRSDVGMKALAVDRVNGYIYYTPGYSPLYRKNIRSATIETDTPEVFDLSLETAYMANFGTTGIAVDAEGYVYITSNISSSVLKYDPRLAGGSRVVAAGSLGVPWDVAVKGKTVLVTDSTAKSIAAFDLNLKPIGAYSGSNLLIGPERFLGASDLPGIYLIDEYTITAAEDRLVYMEDISGAGWAKYGTTGALIDQFKFFF